MKTINAWDDTKSIYQEPPGAILNVLFDGFLVWNPGKMAKLLADKIGSVQLSDGAGDIHLDMGVLRRRA